MNMDKHLHFLFDKFFQGEFTILKFVISSSLLVVHFIFHYVDVKFN